MKTKRKLSYHEWKRRIVRRAVLVGFIPSLIVSILANIEHSVDLTLSTVCVFLVTGIATIYGYIFASDEDSYRSYLKSMEDEF